MRNCDRGLSIPNWCPFPPLWHPFSRVCRTFAQPPVMLKLLLGDPNSRKLRRYQPIVSDIGLFEDGVSSLSDEDLRRKTFSFQERLRNAGSLDNQRPILDEILPEAFAIVREAGKRVLGMRHFDVQLIGGMVLHEGQIAEMKTGEGKTLVATLPSYLNALTGRGVHVVTVNDYLARRDAEWMGQVHRFLGLSVGLIQQDMRLMNDGVITIAISHTPLTLSWVLITCGTTWPRTSVRWCSASSSTA